MNTYAGCTGTLIGKSCMVTAAHCLDFFTYALFYFPTSRKDVPLPEDVYMVDRVSVKMGEDLRAGNDWAVFKLFPNKLTGKYPGDVQGYYPVNFRRPQRKQNLRITGYGQDDVFDISFTQQTATGTLKSITNSQTLLLHHQVDTEPGNSGSAIVSENTQEIIGIHTNGGCLPPNYTYNSGTAFYRNTKLRHAIDRCLKEDSISY